MSDDDVRMDEYHYGVNGDWKLTVSSTHKAVSSLHAEGRGAEALRAKRDELIAAVRAKVAE